MTTLIYTNGIDFDTGNYTIPPMDVDELEALIRGDKPPEDIKQSLALLFTATGGLRVATSNTHKLPQQESQGMLVCVARPAPETPFTLNQRCARWVRHALSKGGELNKTDEGTSPSLLPCGNAQRRIL